MVRVKDRQPVPHKNAKPLRRLTVVLVDLGNPLWHLIYDAVNRMIQRNLYQRVVRKNAGNLPAKRLVHAIVIVGMEKSPILQIPPQNKDLLVRKQHVAVPGHVDVRHVPEFGTRDGHHLLAVGDPKRRPAADLFEKIRETRRIGIPVAAAVVVKSADRKRPMRRLTEGGVRDKGNRSEKSAQCYDGRYGGTAIRR